MLRRTVCAGALIAALASLTAGCAQVHAHTAPDPHRVSGPLSDIEVIDRDSGQRLPIYFHRGRHYVAGTPGARYAVAVRNRTSARVLAVVAVDGVNAVSGETAEWHQVGYVLRPFQQYEVRGWRKNPSLVAAFEFTALSDSYAARTGRPHDVGVIGVALFSEAQPPEPAALVPLSQSQSPSQRRSSDSSESRVASAPAAAVPRSAADAASAQTANSSLPQERLGTGHGRSETSVVRHTAFERARPQPDQVIAIHYDSRANLIALGVISRPVHERPLPEPTPFPGSLGYVPDPPRR